MSAGSGGAGRWLVSWPAGIAWSGAEPVLLCLPSAGAGAGQFRDWQVTAGRDFRVYGVQLPGRENRFTEPPAASMAEAIDAVVTELAAVLPAGCPLVVFGHSFGGLLGFEISRALHASTGRWPEALVVAASRPPHMWEGAGRGLVDDEAELRRLLDVRGLDGEYLDEDTRELMLDLLRQDAQLSLTYRPGGDGPVGCPLLAWGGVDDATVTAAQLREWQAYAGAGFALRLFSGGHYFQFEHRESILRRLGGYAVPARPAR